MKRIPERAIESKLTIRITPRASKNEVTDVMSDGTIKVKIKAPPVDGKANQELTSYLSDVIGISQSGIEITSGLTSRIKTISIRGIDQQGIMDRITKMIKK